MNIIISMFRSMNWLYDTKAKLSRIKSLKPMLPVELWIFTRIVGSLYSRYFNYDCCKILKIYRQ